MSGARAALAARLGELRLAVMLLTRLPVWPDAAPPPALGRAAWAYPVVGGIVGFLGAGSLLGAGWLGVPPPVAVILALGVGIVLTGGLHEDGLADTADGFGGGATRARKLEIMRDSRIGSYGTIAIMLSLMLRAACLWHLAMVGAAPLALVLAAVISRAPLPLSMAVLPPARADGLGRAAGGVERSRWIGALCVAVLLVLVVAVAGGASGAGAVQAAGLLVLVTGGVTALLWRMARRQIGGFTGDTLGAQQQAVEIAALVTLAALWG